MGRSAVGTRAWTRVGGARSPIPRSLSLNRIAFSRRWLNPSQIGDLTTNGLFMSDINTHALDRELKRGSAELLFLSLLDARPRHGYELSKLIHTRSRGHLTFHTDSLYPLLYRLEERGWIKST